MKIETQIKLSQFQARDYQLPIFDAIENKNYKRVVCIMPRRAGKDITAWQICIRQCLKKVCVIYYIFPTYSQAKKVIWNSRTNDGMGFIDFIPKELIASTNSQELKIEFYNGSILQLVGSDNIDSLMGTNPYGVVFSEYALQSPIAYQFIRPILTANNGWALFISTPRGKNHLWELYNIATNHPDWFAYKLTIDDTQHIPLSAIQKEKEDGIMSDDLIQQEYYTSFDMGVEGSYYSKYLDRIKLKGQISVVDYEPGFKVNTAWDLGMRDSTTIIWFQVIGQTIRIFDCYENSNYGLEHYAKIIQERGRNFVYGRHIAPHDIRVRELTLGMSRIERARQLGINFTVAPDLSVEDGIETVRNVLNKCWFDEVKAAPLLKALENYRREYDDKKKIYASYPLHNWASHFSDAFRYMSISLPKVADGLSAEELEKRYRDAVLGPNANMPSVFRNDLPEY